MAVAIRRIHPEVSATLIRPAGTPFPMWEIKRGRREFTPPVATLPLRFYRLHKL
jgi:hypothetical protein